MSVIDVTKMWSKNGGSFTSERYDAFASTYAFTEGYQVVCTVDTPIDDIAEATGIPQPGTQHASGIYAHVNNISPEQISPIMWQVIVSYEGVNPYTGAVEIEWTDAATSEPIDRDFYGRAICTMNGEAVEGLSFDLADQVCVISRKFISINTNTIANYRHAVNSDTFLGWPPGTAKLVGYSAKNMFKFGAAQELWSVTARIQFRKGLMGATDARAWYKRYRHEGLYIREYVGFIRRATDNLGQEVTKPVLLDAAGHQETNPDNAIWLYSKIYDSLPYSGLGLI